MKVDRAIQVAVGYLLDLITIIAVAGFLTECVWQRGLASLSGGTRYLPWTDPWENIYIGFLINAGDSLYEDVAMDHMPGVPQLLALFLHLFGFGRAVPSLSTAYAAAAVSIFVVLVLQIACVYSSMRMLSFSTASSAILSGLICFYTAFVFDFMLPMSETTIAYALIPGTVLAYAMIMGDDPHERVIATAALAGPFTFATVTLGLTAAPANLLILLACGIVMFGEVKRGRGRVGRWMVTDCRSHLAGTCMIGLLAAYVTTTRIAQLYFWNIQFTHTAFNVHPLSIMLGSFAVHFGGSLGGLANPLGSRYPELLAIIAAFVIVWIWKRLPIGQQKEDWGRMAAFIGLVLGAAVLTQWRFNSGYKSSAIYGLSAGVLLLMLSYLPVRLKELSNWALLVVFLPAIIMSPPILMATQRYSTVQSPRDAAFAAAHVCRLYEWASCRCVLGTVWGEQVFLENDMRPCPRRMPTANEALARVPVTHEWLLEDPHRADVAFLVYDDDQLLRDNGWPQRTVQFWRSEANCLPLERLKSWKLCYSPAKLDGL